MAMDWVNTLGALHFRCLPVLSHAAKTCFARSSFAALERRGTQRFMPKGTPMQGWVATSVNIDSFLQQHRIVVVRVEHPAVMTVEESERLVPPLPGAKTKNLFLRDKKGTRHFLVTVPANRPVDLNGLGAALGAGRVGFASPERLEKYLGIKPGAVSLLALVNDKTGDVEFVIDRALWDAEAVQAHPLVNTATTILPHADLERFLRATGHPPRVIDVPAAAAN
jgi:Ala-tRNA(Pro) deacylase